MDDTTDELFCDLMELPPGERVGALGSMADLTGERKSIILRMLREVDEAEDYFTGTSVAVKMLPVSSHVEGEGDVCGPYKLIRKLGEGGFGVVWLAEQEKPLRRSVAVKVIKAGMDSAEVLARFDAEKQALARMNHPNIAKVLDAGVTHQGRPYFVMELVEGRPITRFCKENGLGTHERLRLFADVCGALNHAHQKGVIHRDIKPSNVIVTEIGGKALVKVIDFGIAKAIDGHLTDRTLHTRAEQWIGTPAYMSPEQASLAFADLDTRSDIYTLGVLLYELITGVAPFDSATLLKAGYEEMRRIIREEEPPRPSARIATETRRSAAAGDTTRAPADMTVRGIASELDWIVMKAIEKSRDRRYGTAAALADDVARYLSDEPIEARPPSRRYLLSKFARRHRLGIHIASAFLLLIVGAVLLSVWLAIRARDAEKVAQQRLTEALRERDSKNQALAEAESVSGLLADVFKRPQPGVDGRSVTVMQALDAAVEKLEVQLATQPHRQAVLRGILADTYQDLGIFDRSLELRERNLEKISKASGSAHRSTRMALRKLIEAAEAKGDSKTALEYALLETDALQDAKATPTQVGESMRSVIRGLSGTGDRQKAIVRQRELVEHCLRAFGLDSGEHAKAKWELKQYEASAYIGVNEKDPEERKHSVAEITAKEKHYAAMLAANGLMDSGTIAAKMELADTLLREGHTIEALHHIQALQSLAMELFGPHDDRTLSAQRFKVYVSLKLSRQEDAVRAQQGIVDVLRERDGGSASTTVSAENSLERRFFYSGLRDEYRAYLKDLISRRTELFGKDHPNTVKIRLEASMSGIGNTEDEIKDVIRLMKKSNGEKGRSTASAIATLARHYANTGRVPEAIPLYAECAPNMLDDTWLNFECASFQLWTGDVEGFRKTRSNIANYWDRSINRDRFSPDQFDRAMWLCCIAELDDENQKDILRRILAHVESVREGIHVNANDRHSKPRQKMIRGAVLHRLGMDKEALITFQEAILLMNPADNESLGFENQQLQRWGHFFMAMAQHRLGNSAEAKRLFDLGTSMLWGGHPSKENPVVQHVVGGEPLTVWIMHKEAKALLTGE